MSDDPFKVIPLIVGAVLTYATTAMFIVHLIGENSRRLPWWAIPVGIAGGFVALYAYGWVIRILTGWKP